MTGVAFRADATPHRGHTANGIELQQHERGIFVVRLWYEWWHSGLRRFLWFRAGTSPYEVRADEPVLG